MAKQHSILAVALSAFFACSAGAETPADTINRLNAEIEILQKTKQRDDNLGVDAILSKMPRVVSVLSFGDQIKAKLELPSGVALTFGEGEVIHKRMRVVAITPREVVVAITPSETSRAAKGKKASEPVLMPLEFLAGARQNQQMMGMGGLPGVPGSPVASSPIPPGLMQAPPMVQGGNLASWPQPPVVQPSAAPVQSTPTAAATVPAGTN